MDISYGPAKRAKVSADRGIDFAQADAVFAGPVAEIEDTRRDYGERRFITVGLLGDRVVVIVWTPRNGSRRIISMRSMDARKDFDDSFSDDPHDAPELLPAFF
jgi:uncharacterized DUF497 family protein